MRHEIYLGTNAMHLCDKVSLSLPTFPTLLMYIESVNINHLSLDQIRHTMNYYIQNGCHCSTVYSIHNVIYRMSLFIKTEVGNVVNPQSFHYFSSTSADKCTWCFVDEFKTAIKFSINCVLHNAGKHIQIHTNHLYKRVKKKYSSI